MSSNLVASRYAKALFKASEGQDSLQAALLNFLSGVNELFQIPGVAKIMGSPVMGDDVKRDLINYVRGKVSCGKEAEHFSEQLIAAGRVASFPDIFKAYQNILNERKGTANAVLTTATPLTAGELSELKQSLSGVFKKELSIESKVDSSVLGGVVVEVGNFSLDMSVRAKLNALASQAIV
jgi:F-type H+-transporting ATPase subunit delta